MTELLIDKKRVVLPENFSIQTTEENPFFTKNGKYTFDISLSLLDPTNSKIYKHFNRLNNSENMVSKRSAILISDNQVWLNGSEIILEISDTEVKIQLVSGNSELNYLIGGDKKLRMMDLGAAIIDPLTIVSNLNKPYPESNWLLIPFANSENDYLGNDYYHFGSTWSEDAGVKSLTVGPLKYAYDGDYVVENLRYENYRPQPYLCFMMSQILNALGYSVGENSLADHLYIKKIYIVHGFDTLNYSGMLPDWTVKTFFEEIEKSFDCTVVINESSKTVDILFNHQFLSTNEKVQLEIFDEFTNEIDSSNRLSHQNVNIGYNLDSDLYYKFAKIEKVVKEKATTINLNTVTPEYDLIDKVTNASDPYRYNKIFLNTVNGSKYIAYHEGTRDIPKQIDSFQDLINNPDDQESIDIELNIIPAPMKWGEKWVTALDTSFSPISFKFYWQCPIAEYADPFIFEDANNEPDFTMQGLISGDQSIADHKTSKLRIAMYDGQYGILQHDFDQVGTPIPNILNSPESNQVYPLPFVETMAEYFESVETYFYFIGTNVNPLRLKYLYDTIYNLSKSIDTTKTYKFLFCSSKGFDIKSRFVIKNREYLCSKIQREILSDGVYPIITGYFYPLT